MLSKGLKAGISLALTMIMALSVIGCSNSSPNSSSSSSSKSEKKETKTEDAKSEDAKTDESNTDQLDMEYLYEEDSEMPLLHVNISGNKKGSPVVEREYTTLFSDGDDLLYQNPNRGLRGFNSLMHFDISKEEVIKTLEDQTNSWYKYTQTPISILYLFPGDYLGKPLDNAFFKTTQIAFDYFREKKIQILLRFAYYDVNVFNKRTPTTEELLLHINQLAENGIIERNKDILHVFQAGFIGQFGEWHSDVPRADRHVILTALADKLWPEGVYSQVRNPDYKDFLDDGHPKKKMIGFNNDGWFGIQDTTGLGNQNYSYGLEPWERNMKEGAYVPSDGEFYYWSQFESSIGYYPDGYACILGMSQLRFTTFSAINGWLDRGILQDNAMVRCMKQPVTEKWLREYDLPYSENWFKSADGKKIRRNTYEYMRDYLGYRLTAKTLSVKEKVPSTLNITLTLENHGFCAAFNITSRLVILNAQNKVISSVGFGDPKDWHSTNPDDYNDRKVLEHVVTANMKKPSGKGQYKIALQLLSKGGGTARLDNNIPFEDGYNILHTFEIQ